MPTPLRTHHAPTCNLQIVGELHALQRRRFGTRPSAFWLKLESDVDVVITKLNNTHDVPAAGRAAWSGQWQSGPSMA